MKTRDKEASRPSPNCTMETKVAPRGANVVTLRPREDRRVGPASLDSLDSASGQRMPLTHERIAERARALWRASGCMPGRDEQNWREAEAQLKAKLKLD
jgi:hypothetical protein